MASDATVSVDLVAVGSLSLAVITAYVGVYFLGRRSNREQAEMWRSNYDAAHEAATRLQATLVEKDRLLEGMSGRLQRLDEVLQEMGGARVVSQLMEMQKENLRLFADLTAAIQKLEANAAGRDEKIVRAVEKLTTQIQKGAVHTRG